MRRFLLLLLVFASMSGMAGGAYCEPYPPSVVTLFNKDCGKDAYMVRVCGCVIDRVQETVPLAEFIEEGGKQGGIAADPRYRVAIKGCVAKYPRNSAYTTYTTPGLHP